MLKPYNKAELSFSLGQEIGEEGRNSKVFVAHDPQLDAELVIKRIEKSSLSDRSEFYQESSILNCSSHPNVVPIHYACEDEDYVYLAMPYYQSGSLNKLMNSRHLTVREIIRYGSQFISGLHNIHSKQLIHFDIKPDNILLTKQNEAVVADFGLSKRLLLDGTALQDWHYLKMIPPEAYTTNSHGPAFDIYQAGLTLYRMCVGNAVFYSQFRVYGTPGNFDHDRFEQDIRSGRFPKKDIFPEHIPQALINVVKKCLEPNPADRFTAAIHVINAFADIQEILLDWKYSVLLDGTRTWEKVTESRTVILSVDPSGASLAKKAGASGPYQRITSYCLASINKQKIKSFLREF